MNGPVSAAMAEAKPNPKSGLEKLPAEIEEDSERTKSSLARLSANSADKLEGLMSEIQEMLDFLRSESERVQGEITGYAELNQKIALAATKIRAETVGLWKGTATASDAQYSRLKQLTSGRERIKRWPAPPD